MTTGLAELTELMEQQQADQGRLRGALDRVSPRGLVAAAVALVLALAAAIVFWPGSSSVTVTAHLSSAVGLYPGSDVRILGVPVGKVESVKPAGSSVTVVLRYDDKYRVPADAKAAVVSPSLVSDRYVQLLPAYTGGPAMRDGADIPLERTAVPVELDQITGNLDRLSTALGPNGANKNGALSDLLDTASKNLDGNGQRIHDTVGDLSQATATLAGGREDLFSTVKNLQAFTSTLAANDPEVRRLNTDLASVSDQLAGERDDLGAALQNLAVALGAVSDFVHDNRSVLTTDIGQLADVTTAVAKQKDAIAETLRNAPVALSNLGHAYDPVSGTLDNRVDLPGAEGVSQLLCALVAHGTSAATSSQLCTAFDLLNDRLSALGDSNTGDLPLGLLGSRVPSPTGSGTP
jgi:phospholipid/cholesterol/gamma-HCH transport system substrate-binding protein